MPVQDLTPQLRTRLSRVERSVGWFVVAATLLLVAGFAYYIYHAAQQKGWFKIKIPYYVYVRDATGLNVGDPVRLMGFDVGQITEVTGTEAGKGWFTDHNYNVFVQFRVREPYFGYIWTDSSVRIGTGDLLGKRVIEISKGATGEVTVATTEPIMILNKKPTPQPDWVRLTDQPDGIWITNVLESPALTEHLDEIARHVKTALPGVFILTNQVADLLTNSAALTGRAREIVADARPLISNLTALTASLTNGQGALGELLIPANLNLQLHKTLSAAEATLVTTDTNIARLAAGMSRTLDNLANITSNLNTQVQANDQILSQLSDAIVNADKFVQGLRQHWFLRSAFRERPTNEPPDVRRKGPWRSGKHRE